MNHSVVNISVDCLLVDLRIYACSRDLSTGLCVAQCECYKQNTASYRNRKTTVIVSCQVILHFLIIISQPVVRDDGTGGPQADLN
jgi:hypothetical protein